MNYINKNNFIQLSVDKENNCYTKRLKSLELTLISEYGILISMRDMAKLLHKSYGGLRMSIVKSDSPAAVSLNQAKKKIGRRVYFRSLDVARILLD